MENGEEQGKPKAKLKYAVPKQVGAAIDLLYRVRADRKALQAKMEAEKEQEGLIEGKIFDQFGKQEIEGARGKLAQCSIKRSEIPTADDWEAIERHVRKTGEFDLLHRRLTLDAVRQRWAAGKTVPGVEVFHKVGLSLTKVKA